MVVRWVATALLEAQNRFRLKGYRHLPRFLAALEDELHRHCLTNTRSPNFNGTIVVIQRKEGHRR